MSSCGDPLWECTFKVYQTMKNISIKKLNESFEVFEPLGILFNIKLEVIPEPLYEEKNKIEVLAHFYTYLLRS